jgi:hypothetical protein
LVGDRERSPFSGSRKRRVIGRACSGAIPMFKGVFAFPVPASCGGPVAVNSFKN